ncbi:RNA polymerase subunit sigma-54 [Longibacter salinarum]|uniref:RNA polymerase subunit sigma-54 n=1 Tax=Longibacter salinarum TaxID=1850348 RepID=A0A2A8CU32_9BACT|nr:sigma 54-interacting transcriptional regulator [Longibacter salinarum]PEN11299.1 RNA polymerase subunit sigma-54 [Longibacter salinarum]
MGARTTEGDKPVWVHSNNAGVVGELCLSLTEAGIKAEVFRDDLLPEKGLIIVVAASGSQLVEKLIGDVGDGRIVVVVTDRISASDAWKLLDLGAVDVISYHCPSQVARSIQGRLDRWTAIEHWIDAPIVSRHLIGRSRAWKQALRRAIEAALFSQGPILIQGETGTGKELVARLIHTLDPRPDKEKIVVLDCTTIVPELSGSEFFGHEKGAFTNALKTRVGACELADGGTLFLDEIGDLPGTLQAELLRVIQEKTFKRVGSHTWRSAEFRLVCATHRDLRKMIEGGTFREDLYHRIAGWEMVLPPLRDRREDIILLANHFLAEIGTETPIHLDPLVQDALMGRDFSGNVRELRQLIRRMGGRHLAGGLITMSDLPAEDGRLLGRETGLRNNNVRQYIRQAIASGIGLKELCRRTGDLAVEIALEDANGNVSQAAERLQVTRRTIQMRKAQS